MNYLIKDAQAVLTPNFDTGKAGGYTDVRITEGKITQLGQNLASEQQEQVINASDCVVYPGLINTHHHIAQTALKSVPAGLNVALGEWLEHVPFRFWPSIEPDLLYYTALLGFAELARSGVTTCCDHHYLYHKNVSQELEDALWQAADDIGIRLVVCRGGSTTIGSHRGLRSTNIQVESVDTMLDRLDYSYSRYHQNGSNALRKLVVAPTSLIHSSTPEDLKLLAKFARDKQLKMHSHLLEVTFDQQQSIQKYGMTAVEYAQYCDWLGSDVWFAHLVNATQSDIQLLAETGTSVAHCPTSNCRLGSGIAPIYQMNKAGMNITIGVDGSASAESGSMIQEVNLACLLQRSVNGAGSVKFEQALDWATVNGANMLGLSDVGCIEVGKSADLVLYDVSHFRNWGHHSPELTPVIAGEPVKIKTSFVNGNPIVNNGKISGIELDPIRAKFMQALARLQQSVKGT